MVPRRAGRADAGAAAGLAGHRRGPAHADPGTDRLRQDAGRLPRLSRSPVAAGPAAARRAVLYISPLKALNNDIYRNLQVPLRRRAPRRPGEMGQPLPAIEVAVRTGDTPTAERQRLIRRPPHVLITTPESLHLLLTSRARDTLRSVTHCIVDEIHALCPNKRGVFLALLLERLAACSNPRGFVRIGLSATQRPLEEVARYLGGCKLSEPRVGNPGLVPRPVTIVDAGLRKDLDLRVVSPVEQFGPLPEKSIWPSIYRLLGDEIRRHRSTIVFANNRRTVERITAILNGSEVRRRTRFRTAPAGPRPSRQRRPGSAAADRAGPEGRPAAGRGGDGVAGAGHRHGRGRSGLPGGIAGQRRAGLQRVGRAGHLVGQKSKGRLIPKTPADLLEQAVLAREMAAGRVEEIRVPHQLSRRAGPAGRRRRRHGAWDVPALYALVRRAYPFRDLTPQRSNRCWKWSAADYRR